MKRLALLLSLLVAPPAWACEHYSRKYNTATTVDFCLWKSDGTEFKTDAASADGDVMVMKDEGAEANIAASTEFTDEGQCYSLALTATETTAARIKVLIVDQGTKAWLDKCLTIETYGHASAQHDIPDANTAKWSGTTVAAPHAAGYPVVTVKDGTGAGEINTDSGAVANVTTAATCTTATTCGSANVTAIDGESTSSVAELSSCPSSSPSLMTMMKAGYQNAMYKQTATASTVTLYKYNSSTALCTATISDDGSTFTYGRKQ